MGYAPGWSGLGEDLPKGVFQQWVRWVMSERYLFDEPISAACRIFRSTRARCARCALPTILGRHARRSNFCVRDLPRAKPEILTITPAEAGARNIGHLGFFRPEHRDTLWRGAAEWLRRRDSAVHPLDVACKRMDRYGEESRLGNEAQVSLQPVIASDDVVPDFRQRRLGRELVDQFQRASRLAPIPNTLSPFPRRRIRPRIA